MWCGLTLDVAVQRMTSKRIFTAFGHALHTDLWMELRRASNCWPKPAATGNHAQSFGFVDASRAPGHNLQRHWRRNMDRWRTTPLLCTVQEACNQKIHAVANVVMGLSLLIPQEA